MHGRLDLAVHLGRVTRVQSGQQISQMLIGQYTFKLSGFAFESVRIVSSKFPASRRGEVVLTKQPQLVLGYEVGDDVFEIRFRRLGVGELGEDAGRT